MLTRSVALPCHVQVQVPPDAPARAACAALERAKRQRETDAAKVSRIDSCLETLESLCAKRVRHAKFYEQLASAVLGAEGNAASNASGANPEFLENADRAARAAQQVLELGGLDPAWFEAAVQQVVHNEHGI